MNTSEKSILDFESFEHFSHICCPIHFSRAARDGERKWGHGSDNCIAANSIHIALLVTQLKYIDHAKKRSTPLHNEDL